MSVPLLSQAPEELATVLGGSGRARMIFKVLQEGKLPFEDDGPSSSRLHDIFKTRVESPQVIEHHRWVAKDGTVKLLLGTSSGDRVETVLIPSPRRTTLCVSSQVGCARACGFCLTATMGLKSNLKTEDIVAQVFIGLRTVRELRLPPLRNLVFMGMGEPLDNWSSVEKALNILLDPRGFSFAPRHVTVSTVAPVPHSVERLRDCSTRIAWSLHAAQDDVRKRLIPTQRHSVEAIMNAFTQLFEERKDPLFVEIALIDSINDGRSDADAALRLFKDFPNEVRFNLLPLNPTGRGFQPSRPDKVETFAARLRDGGHFTMVRTARGQDSRAACGQLATLENIVDSRAACGQLATLENIVDGD